MIRANAYEYFHLGQLMFDARITYDLDHYFEKCAAGEKVLSERGVAVLKDDLSKLMKVCDDLGLHISKGLLAPRLEHPPNTQAEFDLLVEATMRELQDRAFLFFPAALEKYFEQAPNEAVLAKFPTVSRELFYAGNSLAFGLLTASVFHSMRAAEIGVRLLATELGVELKHPLELSEWGAISAGIRTKIEELEQQPRSTEKERDLAFFTAAAAQLFYFNKAWRVRVAHARETYSFAEAAEVFEHVRSYFAHVASRFRE